MTHYRLWVDNTLLAEVIDNRHSVCEHRLPEAISAQQVKLEMVKTAGSIAALYALNVR